MSSDQLAVDEKVIRVNGDDYWLYGAVDPETNEILHFRLFPAATKQTTRWFLTELHRRYQLDGVEFLVDDADYNLHNILRHKDILSYDDHLAHLVGSETLLEPGSREEIELRIATVAAADQLMTELNDRRDTPVYGPQMDYKLFSARDEVDTPVHKTKTTDY